MSADATYTCDQVDQSETFSFDPQRKSIIFPEAFILPLSPVCQLCRARIIGKVGPLGNECLPLDKGFVFDANGNIVPGKTPLPRATGERSTVLFESSPNTNTSAIIIP